MQEAGAEVGDGPAGRWRACLPSSIDDGLHSWHPVVACAISLSLPHCAPASLRVPARPRRHSFHSTTRHDALNTLLSHWRPLRLLLLCAHLNSRSRRPSLSDPLAPACSLLPNLSARTHARTHTKPLASCLASTGCAVASPLISFDCSGTAVPEKAVEAPASDACWALPLADLFPAHYIQHPASA